MKTIVVLCEPGRVDPFLIESLRRHFPECDIRIAFAEEYRNAGRRRSSSARHGV